MFHYVYKITNMINDKYYYGKRSCSCSIDDDMYMGSSIALKNSIKKYGLVNFIKEIVKTFDTEDEAYKYEEEIITIDMLNDKNCYNLKGGGTGCGSGERSINFGRKHSEETKQKMSVAKKGTPQSYETKNKRLLSQKSGINHHNYGKTFIFSEETKQKMSVSKKGTQQTEDHIFNRIKSIQKPIYQFNKHGELIREWSSATEAGKTLNIHISHITGCCKDKIKSIGGFIWKYA